MLDFVNPTGWAGMMNPAGTRLILIVQQIGPRRRGNKSLIGLLAGHGGDLRSVSPSITRLPASVILMRPSRAEPDVRTAPLPPTVPLDIKPTENGIEARPPQTLPQKEGQSSAPSQDASTCFHSASAVRQNYPGRWPSWTLRAPGHEGAKCWYAAKRATAHDHP